MSSSLPSAPGELDLTTLLSTLTTTLYPSTFVFITLPSTTAPLPSLSARLTFQEAEGLTIVTTESEAIAHSLEYSFRSRIIKMNVHSSLEAVGFIAQVTRKLTEKGIGANPVSGFFHDHLFVPVGMEQDAIAALEELVEEAER